LRNGDVRLQLTPAERIGPGAGLGVRLRRQVAPPAKASRPALDRPRIAALVDLPRSTEAGGHVKYWERIAAAAAKADDFPFDLTVYFSGEGGDEALAPHVRLRHLKPVFSTARLTFLPYVPDHSDLASFHPRLARDLPAYDLIHTTDGYFAFAKTAERFSRRRGVPLTNSFHTDTPAYTRIFTHQTIERLFRGWPWLQRKLIEDFRAPERQGAKMERLLKRHLGAAARAFFTRAEDRDLAGQILGADRVSLLRIGVDKALFSPHRHDSAALRRDYAIPDGRAVALFVGRVDVGKNVPVLLEAAERAIAAGAPLHFIVAGLGPMREELARRLAGHVSLPGFVSANELGRLYASVDFVALPSEVEIGGMAVAEAIAAGAPMLLAAKASSASVFDHADAIRLVAGGAETWTKALAEMAHDPGLRRKLRRAALDYAAQRLASWSDVLRDDLTPGWRAALARAPA
jgi:glycosyltransferase involved in cell wall biosynthesis